MTNHDPTLFLFVTLLCFQTTTSSIDCPSGFYRRHSDERCLKCTEPCPGYTYKILECQKNYDTVCCPGRHYHAALNTKDEYVCHELPWLCTRGQYFDDGDRKCTECQRGYFMPFEYHAMRECIKCPNSSDFHLPRMSVVNQECNQTHEPIIGCKDGYFLDRSADRRSHGIGCSPCKNCSDEGRFEGQSCEYDQDTICCDKHNMTVILVSDGVRTCVQSVREKSEILQCPDSFCMHMMNNSAAKCEPCEITIQQDGKNDGKTESWKIFIGCLVTSNIISVIIIICLCCINRIKRRVNECSRWLHTRVRRMTRWWRRTGEENVRLLATSEGPRHAGCDFLTFHFTVEDFNRMEFDEVVYSPIYKFKSPNSHRVQGGVLKMRDNKLKLDLIVSPDPRDHDLRWPAVMTWRTSYIDVEKEIRPLQGETKLKRHRPRDDLDPRDIYDVVRNGIEVDMKGKKMIDNDSITLIWDVILEIPPPSSALSYRIG